VLVWDERLQELVLIMAFSSRAALLVLAVLMPVAALAQPEDTIPGESYSFQAQVRAEYVNPTNRHLPLNFDVGGTVVGELAVEWLFMPRWSTEISLAAPASLDVQGGPGSIRITTQTWTVKYYFPGVGSLSPYIGAGLYHASASRDGTPPNIGVSNPGFNWVLQGGFTFGITPNLFVSGDIRYLDGLEPALIVDGAQSGEIGIDPIYIGIGIGLRF
jgi:outer membrane protein W